MRLPRVSRWLPMLAITICTHSSRTNAQSPVVDSANAARAAWGRAGQALQRADTAGALREITRAATAWPTQQAYVWARAELAARTSDTAVALAALYAYADLGLGRNLHALAAFAKLRGVPAFERLADLHDANRANVSHGAVLRELPDTSFWPEGIGYDPRSGDFVVASVRQRTIARVGAHGETHLLWPPETQGVGALLGVRFDTLRQVIWATTSGIPQMLGYSAKDSAIAALLEIDAADGRIKKRWNLPVAKGGRTLGDLAIGPHGDVFLTDSNHPELYRLRPGADSLERFTNPLFRSLQGVAPAQDGRFVYVADYSHGLLRLDLATGAVLRLPDAPHSTSLGIDGMVLYERTIIAVQNGHAPARIVQFGLSAAGDSIATVMVLDQNAALAPEPTIGTLAGHRFVYVANSLWDEFDDNGRQITGRALSRPRLIAVELPV